MAYLWLLKRDLEDVRHDENEAFVVIADTSDQARDFAANASDVKGDENSRVWLDASRSDLDPIGEAHPDENGRLREHGVIVRSFNAG